MKRHRSHRDKKIQKLNLVALMDIFTILVFFLMVNSSDVQIKESHESIALPKATTPTLPADSLKLFVNNKMMFIENDSNPIQLSKQVLDEEFIPQLIAQLNRLDSEKSPLTPENEAKGRTITIMSDKAVPYGVMKKILASCAQTAYRDVALAVNYEDLDKVTPAETNRS